MNKISITYLTAAVFSVSLTFPQSSHAISLEDGKKKGLVGESANGYLEPVVDSPEAKALTENINVRRKAAYKKIAEKNGSPLEVVEQIGGKEAIENSQSGTLVKSGKGGWVKK